MTLLDAPTFDAGRAQRKALILRISAAAVFLLLLTWWLAAALSVPRVSGRIPQFVIVVVSFSLWLAACEVLDVYVPREGGLKDGPPIGSWGMVELVAPLAAAVLLAKFLGWVGNTHEAREVGRR